MLVLILYSPIGSPENYVHNTYFIENQGVSFAGRIQNAPRAVNFSTDNSTSAFNTQNSIIANNSFANSPTISLDDNNINVATPDYKSVNHSTNNASRYAVANASSYTNSVSTLSNNTAYNIQSNSSNIISNQNNSGSSFGGGMGNVGSIIIGKTNNENNPTPQLNGFIALNDIDLTVFDDLTSKQGGTTSENGGMSPGGDPSSESDPIPVPDGFWLLLMMVLGYTAFKYLKKKYQTIS